MRLSCFAAPLPLHPPPAIQLQAKAVLPLQIHLSWVNDLADGDRVIIERSIDGKVFIKVADVAARDGGYVDSRLLTGTTYFYRAISYNAFGDSPYSNIAQALTLGSPPELSVAQWGTAPVGDPPAKLSDVVSLAAGNLFCLALKRDGTVIGWGASGYAGGNPPESLKDVVAIAAGYNHGLALKSDGTVVGWGGNTYGQATPPKGLKDVVAIAAGDNFSLALRRDGTVIGWGDNHYHQAIPPLNLSNVVAIAAADNDALALKQDGTVVCWGNISPSVTLGLTNVAAIAVGGGYNLALKNDGTVFEWQYNGYGYGSPAPVPSLTNVVAVAAGGNGFLALKSDGSVMEYGYGYGYVPYGLSSPAELQGVVFIAGAAQIGLALTTHPGAPLHPLARIDSSNQVTLSWTDNSDSENSFTVERASEGENDSPGSLPVWTQIGTVGANTTHFTDGTVVSSSNYLYRIQAHNLWGGSLYSDTVVVGMKSPITPGDLRATIGAPNQANIVWYENSGYRGVPEGFQIERAPDNGGSPGTWSEIGSVSATNATIGAFTDTNVMPFASQWYRVRAFNVFGDSAYSDPVKLDVVPPAVPNLYSAQPHGDKVLLLWYVDVYSRGVDSFQIERAPDNGGNPGTWMDIATVGVSNTINGTFQYTDTNRTLGSIYWYRVRAHNWIGDSEYSSPASATIVLPFAPTLIAGEIGNEHEVNLSWYQNSSDAAGFEVERAPDADGQPGTWSEIGTTPVRYIGGDYYCSDTNVTALTTNWYRVRAFNVLGKSDYSQPMRVQVIPPPTPNYFSAKAFRDQVKLSWVTYQLIIFPGQTGNSSYGLVSQFKIERAPDVGGSPGTWTQIAEVDGDATAYTDTGRPANSTWWYRVQPSNWVGDGEFSDPASATIVPPLAPNSFSVRIGPTNQVLVAWYDNYGDADGFNLERAPDEGGQPGAWSEIATIPATNLYSGYYLDTNVTAFTTNWYRVRAFNLIGQSDYTPATNIVIVPPPAPANVAAAAHRDQIDLSWTGPDYSYNYDYGEVAAFQVERAADQNGNPGTWNQIATVPATNQYETYYYYTNSDLGLNDTYWYRVRAVNWVGLGDYSASVSATIKLPPPPYSLSARVGETNQVQLFWNESSPDADGFQIERAPDANGNPGEWSVIGSMVASNAYGGEFTDTNVLAFSTNWYRVRAFNVLGDSDASSPVQIGTIPPPMPYDLNASPMANRINLRWYDYNLEHDNVDSFQIERATDDGGSPGTWTQIGAVTLTNSYGSYFSYTDTGLALNTTYWYRVRAHNWIGGGEFVGPVSATVVPPAPPYGLSEVIGTTNCINLSWHENPADEDGFRIQRASDVNGEPGAWTGIGSVEISNTSYGTFTDTNVLAFTTNWYRVASFNVFGDSLFSTSSVVHVVPPPAPEDPTASAYRDQIHLSWSSIYYHYGTIAGFQVERALDAGGQPGPWSEVGVTNLAIYSDRGLVLNRTYWYRVRAFNWVGDGAYSSAVSATIVPPGTPSSLSGKVGSLTNQVTLSWTDSHTDEDGFLLERASDVDGAPGTWKELGTILDTNAYYGTYTDTNALGNTSYWYRVRAFNSQGASDYSTATSVAVIPPSLLQYLFASVFRDQVHLSWYSYYDFSTIDGFTVERASDNNGVPGSWSPIAQVDGNAHGYDDSGLEANHIYWYRVRAFNWVGEGEPSSTVRVTILPPGIPSSLHGLIASTNEVKLSWYDAQEDEDGFQIERAPDVEGSPGAWSEVATEQITNASDGLFVDTNVTVMTTNWYRVRAFSSLGVSDYGGATSVAIVPPHAPNFINADVLRDQVRLSWYAGYPSDYGLINGYKVERAPDIDGSPGNWTQIAQLSADTNYVYAENYTDSDLTVNSGYWYRVRAFNWVGDGKYSDTVKALILPPAAPTGLSGNVGSTNQVNLSWYKTRQDEDGFELERAPDKGGVAGNWTNMATIYATNAYNGYFTDTDAMAFTTNWYRVRAFNSLGISDYSAAISVAIVPPTAPYLYSANVVRNQVNLSWNGDYYNVELNGFKVERATVHNGIQGPWTQIAQVSRNIMTYQDNGLTADTTYRYRVRAFDWVGDGDYSAVRSVVIVPPANPTSLSGVIGTTNQINLSWYQYPADENGFLIERAPDVGGVPGAWTEIGTEAITNASNGFYADTNVTALTTNWYRVRAFNELGTSDYSVAVQLAAVPPPPPSYLSATAYRDQIKLSWSGYYYNYGTVEGFKIERAPDQNGSPGTWTQIAQTSATATSYSDKGFNLNDTYWYRVRAYNWTGDGAYSSDVNATIVRPVTPSALNGQLGSTNVIRLSWYDYLADENGFQVERAPDTGGVPGPWSEIATMEITDVTYAYFADTNVTAFTTNWYRVRAFNGLGVSDYSQPASVTVMPPSHPVSLTAKVESNTNVYLWWYNYSSVNPAEGYLIERATNTDNGPGAWGQIARITDASYSSYNYVDSTALPGGSYWYRVRAYNWVGESPSSPLAAVNVSRSSLAPYVTDASTLHLWPLDETATPCVDSGTGLTDLTALSGGARLGISSIPTLGGCLDLLGDGQNGSSAVLTLAGVGIPEWISYCDSGTGAFTYEAVIHVECDPAQNYGPVSAGGNGRNTPFQIIDADGNTNSERIFQFRIDPIGFQAFSGDTNSNHIRLEFINLNQGNDVQHIITPLPITGDQAIVSNGWYHVAVSYDGNQNVSGNIKFYWTRLNANQSAASLLDGTQTMTRDLAGWSAETVFAIGNAARNPAGNLANPVNANFPGRIDEVRISSVARAATDMLFTNVPPQVGINLLPATATGRNKIRINWRTVSGAWYQVQFKTNLAQPGWINLGSPIQATNSNASWSELIGSDRERFYRIQPLVQSP